MVLATAAIIGAIGAIVVGLMTKTNLLIFLGIIFLIIPLMGGTMLTGIPWWIWLVIVLVAILMLTKKK